MGEKRKRGIDREEEKRGATAAVISAFLGRDNQIIGFDESSVRRLKWEWEAKPAMMERTPEARATEEAVGIADPEKWHDSSEEYFSDLETLQVLWFQGLDKSGNRILRIAGKYFPATVMSGEYLNKYLSYKIRSELPDGPFCILYMHTTVQKEDNNPGMFILRQIYEEMSLEYKYRIQVVYFLHLGLRSWLAITTLGRLLLSGEC
ncbi:hypothetical protein KSP40_PGU007243 [Platanthera guangdongensis]|uniref:CRAL-TRIO domain-containing protein n=1 Tax=Platanthera guangdongensis TaxID=2320717 RepID=A0ABR2N568_9ASPA